MSNTQWYRLHITIPKGWNSEEIVGQSKVEVQWGQIPNLVLTTLMSEDIDGSILLVSLTATDFFLLARLLAWNSPRQISHGSGISTILGSSS